MNSTKAPTPFQLRCHTSWAALSPVQQQWLAETEQELVTAWPAAVPGIDFKLESPQLGISNSQIFLARPQDAWKVRSHPPSVRRTYYDSLRNFAMFLKSDVPGTPQFQIDWDAILNFSNELLRGEGIWYARNKPASAATPDARVKWNRIRDAQKRVYQHSEDKSSLYCKPLGWEDPLPSSTAVPAAPASVAPKSTPQDASVPTPPSQSQGTKRKAQEIIEISDDEKPQAKRVQKSRSPEPNNPMAVMLRPPEESFTYENKALEQMKRHRRGEYNGIKDAPTYTALESALGIGALSKKWFISKNAVESGNATDRMKQTVGEDEGPSLIVELPYYVEMDIDKYPNLPGTTDRWECEHIGEGCVVHQCRKRGHKKCCNEGLTRSEKQRSIRKRKLYHDRKLVELLLGKLILKDKAGGEDHPLNGTLTLKAADIKHFLSTGRIDKKTIDEFVEAGVLTAEYKLNKKKAEDLQQDLKLRLTGDRDYTANKKREAEEEAANAAKRKKKAEEDAANQERRKRKAEEEAANQRAATRPRQSLPAPNMQRPALSAIENGKPISHSQQPHQSDVPKAISSGFISAPPPPPRAQQPKSPAPVPDPSGAGCPPIEPRSLLPAPAPPSPKEPESEKSDDDGLDDLFEDPADDGLDDLFEDPDEGASAE